MEKVTKEVMGAVFYKEGRILVMRRAPFLSWAGWWEFPGGKLEKGETNEECLARELREELGVEAEIGEFLTENSHGYDFGTVHLSVYRVKSWTGDISLVVHDDMHWVLCQPVMLSVWQKTKEWTSLKFLQMLNLRYVDLSTTQSSSISRKRRLRNLKRSR